MKIILVAPSHPYRGGIAAFNDRMAVQLAKEGHNIEVFTFTLQYPSFLFPGKTQYSNDPAPEGIKISRKINSCNPFNWIKVGREIRRANPDLIIMKFWIPFMGPCLGTIARIAKRGGKCKVITVLDNIIPHEKRIGDRTLAKYFAKSMDGFIAMSQSVLDDTCSLEHKKPKLLCPHPLYDHYGPISSKEEAAKALGINPNEDYFLFFGLIRDYKGLDILMKAMADPLMKGSKAKLIVAGEHYGDGAKYEVLEKELGLEGRIIWHTEFVPDDKVRHYFNVADIVVQPYKTATQSGVTQIAYHFERPMLVTNVGGLAEIVPDGIVGYVTEPDPHSVAAALADFYGTGKKDFSQGLKTQKLKYSWERLTETIYKLREMI